MSEKSNKIFFSEKDFCIDVKADKAPYLNSIDDYLNLFHEEIEIKLVLDGRAAFLIDNEIVIAEKGDVVVINPYSLHSNVVNNLQKAKYHLIMIGLDFFGSNADYFDLRRIFIKERTRINSLISGNKDIARIIENIVSEFDQKKDMYQSAVKSLVAQLFVLLLRDYRSTAENIRIDKKSVKLYETVYPALKKIQNGYREKISVDELASLCNVSKYHFCRIFKAVTSVSPIEYQTVYRIGIADILLKNSDKSITEIAYLCGFEDAAYFSRCYKKHTGVSPKEKRAILSK